MENTTYKSINDSRKRTRTAKGVIYYQIMKKNVNVSDDTVQIIADGLQNFSRMQMLAEKTSFPEMIEFSKTKLDIRSGYLCTFSENYMLRRSGTLEGYYSDEELTTDLLFGFDSQSNPWIRSLAELYREDYNVKSLVDGWIQKYVKDEKIRQSYKNILERGRFLTDEQMFLYWKTALGGMYEESERKSDSDE